MVAASGLLVVTGAVVAAENTTFCFHRIAGADNANAIVAGTLHHFDVDAHDLSLVCMVFGFKHVVHHVGQHGANMAVGQLVEDVSPATRLLQQPPCPQQAKVLRNEALADAHLFRQIAHRSWPFKASRYQP